MEITKETQGITKAINQLTEAINDITIATDNLKQTCSPIIKPPPISFAVGNTATCETGFASTITFNIHQQQSEIAKTIETLTHKLEQTLKTIQNLNNSIDI